MTDNLLGLVASTDRPDELNLELGGVGFACA